MPTQRYYLRCYSHPSSCESNSLQSSIIMLGACERRIYNNSCQVLRLRKENGTMFQQPKPATTPRPMQTYAPAPLSLLLDFWIVIKRSARSSYRDSGSQSILTYARALNGPYRYMQPLMPVHRHKILQISHTCLVNYAQYACTRTQDRGMDGCMYELVLYSMSRVFPPKPASQCHRPNC